MDKDMIAKVIAAISSENVSVSGVSAYFNDNKYNVFPIVKSGFESFSECSGEVSFIDGGNCELFSSASSSLQLIRVYCVTYSGRKKINSKKFEFFALIRAVKGEKGVIYSASFFDDVLSLGSFEIDPCDDAVKVGVHQAKISSVGGIIRRLAELKAALLVSGVVVLDGSLQSTFPCEKELLDSLFSTKTVCGISKTTSLLATNGMSIVNVLSKLSDDCAWYYKVASCKSDNHKADIFFTKLHPKSKYIFRFEVFNGSSYDIKSLLGGIAVGAKDPVFIGYPYGLIEADRFARVSNQEKEYYKTILMAKLKDNWEDFNRMNAHDVLDNVG